MISKLSPGSGSQQARKVQNVSLLFMLICLQGQVNDPAKIAYSRTTTKVHGAYPTRDTCKVWVRVVILVPNVDQCHLNCWPTKACQSCQEEPYSKDRDPSEYHESSVCMPFALQGTLHVFPYYCRLKVA